MNLENLQLLETKINQFVDQHARTRAEHVKLLQQLKEKEKQISELNARVKQYEHERTEVKARLERVLKRLQELDLA